MHWMRPCAAAVAAAAFVTCLGGTADAETVTYYYVSAPYAISNYPDKETRPFQTAGFVRIDTSKLSGTNGLKGLTIRDLPYDDDVRYVDSRIVSWPEEVESIGFDSANLPRISVGGWGGDYLIFDDNEQIVDWSLSDLRYIDDPIVAYSSHKGSDYIGGAIASVPYYGDPFDRDPFDYDGLVKGYLERRGYREGTAAYQALFDDEILWRATTYADGGQWFDNLADFVRQVELNAVYAAANPPRSYHDIAPVPLPPPGLMLLAVAAIGAVAGRTRRPSDRSPPQA